MNQYCYSVAVLDNEVRFFFVNGSLCYVQIWEDDFFYLLFERNYSSETCFWVKLSYYLKLILEFEPIKFKKLYEFTKDQALKKHCRMVFKSCYKKINSNLSSQIKKLKSKQNLFSCLKREYLGY